MSPNSHGGGSGGGGGGVGGFTLPGVTVTAGSTIYHHYPGGQNFSMYDMVMGHSTALQQAQSMANSIGSYGNYFFNFLVGSIPGLGTAAAFFNGLSQVGIGQSLSNIIAGIQASQGNIVLNVQQIWGAGGMHVTTYTWINVNTGTTLGSFSLPG
jgi:hypothetical protein